MLSVGSATIRGEAHASGGCRLITAGIDTLDLGFHVRWPSDRLHAQLACLREEASGTDGIQPPGWKCLVLPGGKRMYRYHLEYPEGHLFLSRSHEPQNYPNTYVSISARTLWTLGASAAVEVFREHVSALGGTLESILPSRIDLAADLVIPGGLSFDFLRAHLVTDARKRRPRLDGERLETFYIGKGDLQLRIYDKSAETLASGKAFFLDVWKEKMPDIGENVQHVWRVEGQLRRPILKELRIDSLESLYGNLAGLWNFITAWASLRLNDNENTSRRTLHPLWTTVQSAAAILGDPGLALRRIASESTAPVDWYVAHIAGCLVAFASRLNVNALGEAFERLRQCVESYMPESAFASRVQAEGIRLGLATVAAEAPPPA